MKVVIVEDNPDLAYMLAYVLGFEMPDSTVTTITDNFARAFLPSTWEAVDVAVVDIMLPGIDGRHILRALQRDFPSVYRIAWTAIPAELLDNGGGWIADVVVQKPAVPTLVIDAIRRSAHTTQEDGAEDHDSG